MESIDILILTYQRKKYVQELLEQIYLRTEYPFRVLMIDNGSTDGTREWILKMKNRDMIDDYVFTGKNLLMAEAYTLGMKTLVRSELFVVTQDDLIPPIVSPCWLTQLVKEINERPDFATISLAWNNRGWNRYQGKVKKEEEKTLPDHKKQIINEIRQKIYD